MKYVWIYALIASLGGFLFGFETAVISGAEQIIQKLWNLDSFWHGLTVSISLIGTILGAISAGKFMNKYGRKRVLIAVSIFYLLSAVRSEEHTSELQSRENLVCRLLLDK